MKTHYYENENENVMKRTLKMSFICQIQSFINSELYKIYKCVCVIIRERRYEFLLLRGLKKV